MSKLAVVAIGGNSLIKDEARQSVPDQFNAVRETVMHIAEMIAQGWNVVITHGNGPQVGFILLRSELASNVLHTVPLDSCGADTQGAIRRCTTSSCAVIFDANVSQSSHRCLSIGMTLLCRIQANPLAPSIRRQMHAQRWAKTAG